ncbi:MAG: TlpA family protein disulfide reductase [Planctomycetota bacterium]
MSKRLWGFVGGLSLFLAGCDGGAPKPPPAPGAIKSEMLPGDAGKAEGGKAEGGKVEGGKVEGDAAAPANGAPATDDNAANVGPVQQALDLIQNGEIDKALVVMRAGAKADPQNRELLLGLTQFSMVAGVQQIQGEKSIEKATPLFLEAAQHARRLIADFQPISAPEKNLLSQVFYNEGCMLARTQKTDESMKSLELAVANGFSDLKLLKSDEDLASLRDLDGFKTWLGAVEKTIQERRAQELEAEFAANKPFPFNFTLNDYDGKPRKLADLKGKVVLVDMWATWCGPCVQEIPHLIDLHKKYREQGFEVIGVNYENEEPPQAAGVIKKFAMENGMTYPCVIGDEATQNQIPDFLGFPTLVFLDRTGTVRLKKVGYTEHDILESIITKLLAEKTAEEPIGKKEEKPADK